MEAEPSPLTPHPKPTGVSMVVLEGEAVSYARGTPVVCGWINLHGEVEARGGGVEAEPEVRCAEQPRVVLIHRKVDVRLPGKDDSNSHGARLVDLLISMIKWIRTCRLSKKNSLSPVQGLGFGGLGSPRPSEEATS